MVRLFRTRNPLAFEVREGDWVHPNYDIDSLLRDPSATSVPQPERHDQIIVAVAARTLLAHSTDSDDDDDDNDDTPRPTTPNHAEETPDVSETNGDHPTLCDNSNVNGNVAMNGVNGAGVNGVNGEAVNGVNNEDVDPNTATRIVAQVTLQPLESEDGEDGTPDPEDPNPGGSQEAQLGTLGVAGAWFGPDNRFNMHDFHLDRGADDRMAILCTINHVCERILTIVSPQPAQENIQINTSWGRDLRKLIFKTDNEFATEALGMNGEGRRVAQPNVSNDRHFWETWCENEADVQLLRELAAKTSRLMGMLENFGVDVYLWSVEEQFNREAYAQIENLGQEDDTD